MPAGCSSGFEHGEWPYGRGCSSCNCLNSLKKKSTSDVCCSSIVVLCCGSLDDAAAGVLPEVPAAPRHARHTDVDDDRRCEGA
jgi:hypothetical protein